METVVDSFTTPNLDREVARVQSPDGHSSEQQQKSASLLSQSIFASQLPQSAMDALKASRAHPESLGASDKPPSTAAQAEVDKTHPSDVLPAGIGNSATSEVGIWHLAKLAASSTVDGLTEPLRGAAQLGEQVANSVTESIPAIGTSYFHPDALNSSQDTPAAKYSADWYVKNIFENVGKLPWYLVASKMLKKAPGFTEEAGVLSERQLLGMNVKTAAASGFALGGLNPTEVQNDTSLVDSIKERTLQAAIGGAQMAMMTLGTRFASEGFTAAKAYLPQNTIAATSELSVDVVSQASKGVTLGSITGAALKLAQNGSIATVGSIPAGLAAGYLNAKAHGTGFDITENLVSSATIGFALGSMGGGKQTESNGETVKTNPAFQYANNIFERAKVIALGAPPKEGSFAFNSNDGTTGDGNITSPKPVVKIETLPDNRTRETHSYADGKIVQYNRPGMIRELGNTVTTTYPDGTIVYESSEGTVTEKPDRTQIISNSGFTHFTDANGDTTITSTKWNTVLENWQSVPKRVKIETLNDLANVPRGRQVVSNLIRRALFQKESPEVEQTAAANIKHIPEPGQQIDIWLEAWKSRQNFRTQLIEMIPDMLPRTQEQVMLGRQYLGESSRNTSNTRYQISEMLDALGDRGSQAENDPNPRDGKSRQPARFEPVTEYLEMVAKLPDAIRQKIFDALQPVLSDSETVRGDSPLAPLVKRINEGFISGDTLVNESFGKFHNRQADLAISKLPPGIVERTSLPQLKDRTSENAQKLSEFQDIIKNSKWKNAPLDYLDQNSNLDLHKAIQDWALNQPDQAIRQTV